MTVEKIKEQIDKEKVIAIGPWRQHGKVHESGRSPL